MSAHNGDRPVIVVTGASAGVGRATVRELARKGANLVLVARGPDGLQAARREVERLGSTALVMPADVADPQAVDAAAEAAVERFGRIDGWVNNAMVTVMAPVHALDPAEVRRVTEVTYLGVVHGTLAALRYMRRRGKGTIVQVGSALAHRGIPLQAAYCAAKHAVQGFTESLRAELLHDGSQIKVTIVHLPALNTPQFTWSRTKLDRRPQPVPPIFQPEVAARAICWSLEHPERRRLLVGWPTVETVWGNALAPGMVDDKLARDGVSAQLTDQPLSPGRRENLWEPVPGDHGAHGPFDARASASSPQLWLTTHRSLGILAVGALAGLALGRWSPI